jgi:F420-non-reducing hydrogenase iron-sulfur subunit
MCTGRIDPQFVLKAFQSGADGVMILGCHPGDCHYKEGNYKALRRFHLLKRMLAQFGIEEGRMRLDWVSASEADKFAETIQDMVKTIKALGPLNRIPTHPSSPHPDGFPPPGESHEATGAEAKRDTREITFG